MPKMRQISDKDGTYTLERLSSGHYTCTCDDFQHEYTWTEAIAYGQDPAETWWNEWVADGAPRDERSIPYLTRWMPWLWAAGPAGRRRYRAETALRYGARLPSKKIVQEALNKRKDKALRGMTQLRSGDVRLYWKDISVRDKAGWMPSCKHTRKQNVIDREAHKNVSRTERYLLKEMKDRGVIVTPEVKEVFFEVLGMRL